MAHLFEVRRIIETQAACLAAERRTEADLKRLRELNREYEANLSNDDIAFDANMRFHLAIVETAKNPILTDILGPLLTATVEVYAKARQSSLSKTTNLNRFVAEHEQIIKAIAQQDTELATKLSTNHIDQAQKRVGEIIANELKKGI